MRDITEFEAYLMDDGQVNCHVRRRHKVLLSLPASRQGALKVIGLYRPQRGSARFTSWLLKLLAAQGLHGRILRRGNPVIREAAQAWDFKYSPPTVGVLLGSREHVILRAIASYLGAEGWEVAKLGRGPEARAMFRREAGMLREIASRGLRAPLCLGVHEQDEFTIMRMPYLIGKEVSEDDSEDALDLLNEWIENDPPQPITQFSEWEWICSALRDLGGGLAALEALSCRTLQPVISHGDFARWNLLRQADGALLTLDWEWGIIGGMPGLDLVHYFAQDSRLVRRMKPKEIILAVEAELRKPKAREYLRRTGWGDCSIEPIVACIAYKQGVQHQRNTDLLLECLKEYAIRQRGTTTGSGLLVPTAVTTVASRDDRKTIRFSIITPSLDQVGYLKCCAASVRDQAGNFGIEHLIHDGGTGSEFDQWAEAQQGAVCVSENDDGMYDAINRGFRKANGDIIAWLNCDEQYSPGTLEQVAGYFEAHPEVDVLFGDVILVNEAMTPLAYRRAVVPTLGHLRYSHLSTFSAATFVRRRVLDEGHVLQTRWKTIADAVWIEELLMAGYRMAIEPKPMAVFCMLGTNLGQSQLLLTEREEWESELGRTSRCRKLWYVMQHRLSRLLRGAYWMRWVSVDVYLPGQGAREQKMQWVSGHWDIARNRALNHRSAETSMDSCKRS